MQNYSGTRLLTVNHRPFLSDFFLRGGGGGGLCTGYLCLCPLGLAAKLNFLIYRKWSIAPIEFYIALGLLFCLYEAIKLSKCEVKHK